MQLIFRVCIQWKLCKYQWVCFFEQRVLWKNAASYFNLDEGLSENGFSFKQSIPEYRFLSKKESKKNKRTSAKTVDSWTSVEEDTNKDPETKRNPLKKSFAFLVDSPFASKSCLHSFQRNLLLWLTITLVQSYGTIFLKSILCENYKRKLLALKL